MPDFLYRHSVLMWLVAIIAKHLMPKVEYMGYEADWLPQFWLATLEYMQQYGGQNVLDFRWDCIKQRAEYRVQRCLLNMPLALGEGIS